jgi:hypothetical protein
MEPESLAPPSEMSSTTHSRCQVPSIPIMRAGTLLSNLTRRLLRFSPSFMRPCPRTRDDDGLPIECAPPQKPFDRRDDALAKRTRFQTLSFRAFPAEGDSVPSLSAS